MNNNEQKITLTLAVDEVNLILESLGHQPYLRVHRIIESIHMQASEQLHGVNGVGTQNLQPQEVGEE